MLRIIVGLLVIAGVGGLGLVLFISMSTPPPAPVVAEIEIPRPIVAAPAPVVPPVQILVVGRAVRGGTLLVIDDLSPRGVPPEKVPAGSFHDTIADRDLLRGAMVRRGLEQNEVILKSDVIRPGDRGFLAAVMRPGMRAVTIGVDPVSGIAGLIWPGDRVDILLTQANEDKEQPLEHRVFSETIMRDVRAIAIDQQLVQGGQSTGQAAAAMAPSNRTVTLETSPFDAERLATASRMGKLSLVVRSASSDDTRVGSASCTPVTHVAQLVVPGARQDVATPLTSCDSTDNVPIAWSGSVSPALTERAPPGKQGSSVRVFSGAKSEEVKF